MPRKPKVVAKPEPEPEPEPESESEPESCSGSDECEDLDWLRKEGGDDWEVPDPSEVSPFFLHACVPE
jgi:hypothetical protein